MFDKAQVEDIGVFAYFDINIDIKGIELYNNRTIVLLLYNSMLQEEPIL